MEAVAGLLEADLEAVADFFMVDGDSENLFGTVVYFQGEIFLVRNDWRTVKSNLYEEFQDEVFCGRGDTNFEMPADVGSTDCNCTNIYVRVRGTRLGECVHANEFGVQLLQYPTHTTF